MKLINFLICDDIRQEVGNKLSIIGVYDESIEFNMTSDTKDLWPKVMKLVVFAKFIIDKKDKELNNFKLKVNYNKEYKIIGSGELVKEKMEKSQKLTIAIVNQNFIFNSAGEIQFEFDFYNDKNNLIETLVPDLTYKVLEKKLS